MSNRIPRLALLTLLLLTIIPQANAAPLFEVTNRTIDFGEITKGTVYRTSLIVHNRGDSPLALEKVSSSCGCTAAIINNPVIQPGETGEIKISFDSRQFRGRVEKTIYLNTNDPAASPALIKVAGEVIEELSFEPRSLFIPLPPNGASAVGSVKIVNHTGRIQHVSVGKITTGTLGATLASASVPPGGEIEMTITATPLPMQTELNGYIGVDTPDASYPKIQIPVYARVTGR